MLLTILAIANHFVLDAIVGAVIPVLSWKINEILLLFGPLGEWCFWLCRTERPIPKDGIGDMTIPDEKPGGWCRKIRQITHFPASTYASRHPFPHLEKSYPVQASYPFARWFASTAIDKDLANQRP
jgi:hypothetical protein